MIVNAERPAPATLIPGIYNYCDSWCERCPLTTHCRSYQLKQENSLAASANSNASLVEQLTEALELTKRHIDALRTAEPFASSLSPAETLTLEEAALGRRHQTKDHPLAALATTYLHLTGTWLRTERNLLEEASHQQVRAVDMGLCTNQQAVELLNELRDAHEQIRWYRTLISVKTKATLRALDEPIGDTYLHTYYAGKAKLVLVSIDRSLAAWQTVIRYYPEKVDDLLDMLSLLTQLSRQFECLFPQARTFQRPGLDEGV